ncbi:hypothetical protein IQ07DRAFT_637475 [Pyrenochaeta sp. DS3sAY3a]|nr:hypothetical protein IQ07DRAFT_637475 [Pyrenochaeta sp. DS3sAY3a]
MWRRDWGVDSRRFTRIGDGLRNDQNMKDLSKLCKNEGEQYYILKSLKTPWDPQFDVSVTELLDHETKLPDYFGSGFPEDIWVHVPFTNGLIIQAIISKYTMGSVSGERMLNTFYDQFRLSFVPPQDSYLTYREHMYKRPQVESFDSTVIVFPTLMLTTYGRHDTKRSEYMIEREKMSTRVTGKYANACLMHFERTLDEAYFPGLARDELSARNEDQIASRFFVGDKKNLPIVIVPQLWLWHFNDCLISAHGVPRKSEDWELDPVSELWGPPGGDTGSPRYIMAQLIYRYIKSFGSEGTEQTSASMAPDTEMSGGLIVQTEQKKQNKRISIIDQLRSKLPKHEIETTADVSCKKATLRDETKKPTKTLPTFDLFENHVIQVLSNVKTYMNDTKRSQILYQEEWRFHHDLSDCRSELAMIKYVLDQQMEILGAFQTDVAKEIDEIPVFSTGEARNIDLIDKQRDLQAAKGLIEEAMIILQGYDRRTKKIDGDAERIEKNVQDMLNLKRTFASVQDSHASVLLGLAAGAFAIVTIIFAPLAFLTALFALNVQGFERLWVKDGNENAGNSTSVGGGVTGSASAPEAIYDRRWMSLILTGSVFLTFIMTGFLVWLGMRWLNVDLDHLRFDSQSHSKNSEKIKNVEKETEGEKEAKDTLLSGLIPRILKRSKHFGGRDERKSAASQGSQAGVNAREAGAKENSARFRKGKQRADTAINPV